MAGVCCNGFGEENNTSIIVCTRGASLFSHTNNGHLAHGHGYSKRGRKCTTYPESIVKDLDLEPNEIQQLMMKNKTTWHKFVSAEDDT